MDGPKGGAEPALIALPQAEAERLARQAAMARGIRWPPSLHPEQPAAGFQANLTSHPGRERLVWATPSPNQGMLALFSGNQLLDLLNDGLGEVLRVQILSLPGLPHLALMVDDSADQWVGAFLREESRRIYVWDGKRMRQVYRGPLQSEQLVHRKWESPTAPNVWRLTEMNGDVDVRNGLLTERTRETVWEATGRPDAPAPGRPAFRLIKAHPAEKRLMWNPRLRRFVPA